ncbi:MAG: bifunctional folylpolyglutamate synthase/dihydrofolate synthase [Anaerolineae bacterium]|nr:bifunctional folylpolyglutamate synthase/dihydrofolate synthase [Anaerolineae bacterium]
MDYSEAIAYLHSLTDYEKTRIERYTPETFGLSRVKKLVAHLGDPHTRFPSVHIAGTRGKGSTAAVCEACLRAAGYRTGFYISPHLHTFCERIQVNREEISREDVVALVEEIRPFVERVPGVTTFEAITAMGFLYLARAGVDVAVVEVGLGGRLDATNVLTPEVSIITSLSLEHTYLLGDTLDKIAYEKAGIVKPDVPAVTAPQQDEARIVLETVCRERGAPLTRIGRDWKYEAGPADLDGQAFSIRRLAGDGAKLDGEYWTPLLGRHQLENAACAIAAIDILGQRGFNVSAEAVREGLRTVDWPGRMEILSREPLAVIDCAHNPYAARVLRKALNEWFPDKRWVLVYGASADKDISGVLTTLLPISDYVIVTRSDHPRAAAPAELADIVASAGGGAEISTNPTKALQRALEVMNPGDGLLVTGSIFLAADVREEWARHMGAPLPDVDETES